LPFAKQVETVFRFTCFVSSPENYDKLFLFIRTDTPGGFEVHPSENEREGGHWKKMEDQNGTKENEETVKDPTGIRHSNVPPLRKPMKIYYGINVC
jgi:hypothetical protein